MSKSKQRGRRRALKLSEVDQQLVERGKTPTYRDGAGEARLVGSESSQAEQNDERILAEVPPHAVVTNR